MAQNEKSNQIVNFHMSTLSNDLAFFKKIPRWRGNKDLSLRSSPGCTQICRGCVLHLYTTLCFVDFTLG